MQIRKRSLQHDRDHVLPRCGRDRGPPLLLQNLHERASLVRLRRRCIGWSAGQSAAVAQSGEFLGLGLDLLHGIAILASCASGILFRRIVLVGDLSGYFPLGFAFEAVVTIGMAVARSDFGWNARGSAGSRRRSGGGLLCCYIAGQQSGREEESEAGGDHFAGLWFSLLLSLIVVGSRGDCVGRKMACE